MSLTRLYSLTCVTLLAAPMALAHEFWIEPTEFQVNSGAAIVADLRNGQLFKGSALSYFDKSNTRFEAAQVDETTPITGRMGDRPAIQLPATGRDGLVILVHEAAPAVISYSEWEKFMKFVEHKDFAQAEATHISRGWAQENFKETYSRHSKALVAVGTGAGADRAFGLTTEFVALDNPYAADFDGTLDIELLYDGAPRANAQVEVYARDAQDAVTVTITRTNDQGHAAIPVVAGTEYLLDAVVLRPVTGATTVEAGPVWETLWASMTFAVPAR